MADISFYKYLEAAFRYRLNNPQGKTATLDTKFNYLGFNFTYERIFYYARKILPQFYRNEFPDTEDGNLQMAEKILEKLDKHQDQQLENQFKGTTSSSEDQQIIEEARAESQAEAVQQPAAAGVSAGRFPGIGYTPSTSSASRVIHNILQAKPEVPKAFEQAFSNEPEYKTDPTKSLPSSTDKTAKTGFSPRRLNLSAFRPSGTLINTFKNIGSKIGTPFYRYVGSRLTLGTITTGISAGIGAIAGAGFGGVGMIGGGILGAMTPAWVRSGGAARFLGGVGNGIIDSGVRLSNQIGGGIFKKSSKKLVWIVLGSILLFVLGAGILGGLTGTTPTGTSTGTITTTDISSCKFTRGGDTVRELTYKSPLLLSYVQEASSLTGIPPVVLAAFIRVETPSTVTRNDNEIRNLSSLASCPKSPTGALGVMQLQPKGTTGHAQDAVANGARLIGKSYDDLTEADYCDVRKNIIMGAGFILKKLSRFGYGDGTRWQADWINNRVAINSLVVGYYGCLSYGGSDPTKCEGPYNYGDDVWTSIQNCQTTGVATTLPTTGSPLLDNIVNTARNITSTLSKGSDGLYNVKPGESGVYQCTYLVVDSYQAAGLRGLDRVSHGWVINMKNFFASTPGYKLVSADSNVRSLRSGDVVVLEGAGSPANLAQHISIIKSIEAKDDGTGTITTFDSNNVSTEDKISIRDFKAVKAGHLPRYNITGFGQVANTPNE